MKILFDANTPAPLARFLRGHDVTRADELGWRGMENGALLNAADRTSRILGIVNCRLWSYHRIIGQRCGQWRRVLRRSSISFKLARL